MKDLRNIVTALSQFKKWYWEAFKSNLNLEYGSKATAKKIIYENT